MTCKEDPKPKILLGPSPSGSHLGLPGSRGIPSFRQLTRGVGTPWAWQGSRAVRFTETFTAFGPGWMVGATGERQRAGLGACGAEGMVVRRRGALTVDVHLKSHSGAARGVAGCAAVVSAVGRAQRLQLEEPALLWKLSVGICLQRRPE